MHDNPSTGGGLGALSICIVDLHDRVQLLRSGQIEKGAGGGALMLR